MPFSAIFGQFGCAAAPGPRPGGRQGPQASQLNPQAPAGGAPASQAQQAQPANPAKPAKPARPGPAVPARPTPYPFIPYPLYPYPLTPTPMPLRCVAFNIEDHLCLNTCGCTYTAAGAGSTCQYKAWSCRFSLKPHTSNVWESI